MGKIRYGVGTFILRKEAEEDLFGVLERLREIGYDGVELLGFFGRKPADIRTKLDQLGLAALGDHVDYQVFIKDPKRIIAEHLEVGCAYISIAHREGEFTPWTSEYDQMITGMRALIDACLESGITPQYHNHGWDVRMPSYADALLKHLDRLYFEPDLGWMVYAGADPADYLGRYSKRCRVLHLKDVYAEDYGVIEDMSPGARRRDPALGGFEFRPTGYGTVNFPALMPLCLACDPDWIVADHDLAYERDSYYDLRLSLEYLRALELIAR